MGKVNARGEEEEGGGEGSAARLTYASSPFAVALFEEGRKGEMGGREKLNSATNSKQQQKSNKTTTKLDSSKMSFKELKRMIKASDL
ncbi:hypothetical protein niasHT_015427 [Heterodera trifolii]|uniref:Uncharacterized protein n=1 Tax=Heterodera trifolii TaxID=157864 RepID=A0ABD2L104_9BILA